MSWLDIQIAWNISLFTVMNIHEHSIYIWTTTRLEMGCYGVCKNIMCIFCVGLGPRKFRTKKSDTGDRSVWTDTPADRLKRAQVVGDTRYTFC